MVVKGHIWTKEDIEKRAKSNRGKKRSLEQRLNMSKSHIGYKHKKETCLKIGLANKGKKKPLRTKEHRIHISESRKGKTYEQFYGIEKAKQIKILRRKATIENILLNNGMWPGYNKKACNFFKSFDIENKTQGQYATNGGEYYIKELGYWVDYFNPDLKLIIEWDELRHYDSKGKLKQKDVIRQNEIQTIYSDFEFKRIKEGSNA